MNASTVRFDTTAPAVVISSLTIRDSTVVREARHWTTGRRAQAVEDPDQLADANLTPFVTEALLLGARALAATASTAEARVLEQVLKEVGDKTAAASTKAAELTELAVRDAATAVTQVATDAKDNLTAEIRRLVGGDSPELLDRLQPLLDKFALGLESQVRASTRELLERAAQQFDPSDPTSPMAKLTQQLELRHSELATKVEELTTALKLQRARTELINVTPIKGDAFEDALHHVLHGIATALGEEYVATGTKAGRIPRSKKGDGVLTAGGSANIVLEMTDSPRTGWGEYFDEAERNRAAVASIGIVRTPEQNGGQLIRVLGPRRVVLSFDPDEDDPELLRTVVLLIRTIALTATARTGVSEIATAEEKIGEALSQLERIAKIKRLAGVIHKNADLIDSECTGVSAAIRRLLDEALVGLADTAPERAA